jgi:hypothetical protein
MEHISSTHHFDDETLVSLCSISPVILQLWAETVYHDITAFQSFGTQDIDRFSALASRFRNSKRPLSQQIGKSFAQVIDHFFKRSWGPRFGISPDLQIITLATLCIMMCAQTPQTPGSIARLLNQDFVGFGAVTLVLRPYISTIPVVKFQSEALVQYVKDPKLCGDYNPMTPDIHADLVIYCLEFIKRYRCPQNFSRHRVKQELPSPPVDGEEDLSPPPVDGEEELPSLPVDGEEE